MVGNSRMNPDFESLLTESFDRLREEAWTAYHWMLPDRQNALEKSQTTADQTLGTVNLPYLGETPVELVVFVGSAISFRLYQVWKYYFGHDEHDHAMRINSGRDREGNFNRKLGGNTSWKPDHASASRTIKRKLESRTKPKQSKWWRWWFSSDSFDVQDDTCSTFRSEPDAKATSWGTYKDPSLAEFMNQAQEHKGKLRHVDDPYVSRRKKLQAIRTKNKAAAQGPLGLSDQLLQSTRSNLREAVWPNA